MENPKTQERQGYVGLDALMAELRNMVDRAERAAGSATIEQDNHQNMSLDLGESF